MIPSYSRCSLGKRCVQKTNNSKVFKKYTLAVAITSKGVIGYELYEKGGMNVERLNLFLQKYVVNKYKGYTIIMDNAGSHRNKTTKELIIKSGNKILHSVPYRPSTNAIESWFSQFKKLLYNQPGLNYKDILKNVKSAFRFMKSQKHLNYFKYAYRRQKIKDIINIKKSNKEKKLKKYKSE
jgi:transposase